MTEWQPLIALPRRAKTPFSIKKNIEKVVHFAPESIVHFAPESVVYFTPESLYTLLRNIQEIATTDSINHLISNLYDRVNHEYFYLQYISRHLNKLFDHGGRRILSESLKKDSTFNSFNPLKEYIIIEQIDNEQRPRFDILIVNEKNPLMLRYKYEGKFTLKGKTKSNMNQINHFKFLLQKSNLLDTLKYGSEFDYVVTGFVNDSIKIYPFLCGNFRGDIEKIYMDLLSH